MKSIIYYTDNRIEDPIDFYVKHFIKDARLPIYSASLKRIYFGDNEIIEGERGYPTMVKQIISCLSRSKSKYVFFCEHDVLYHPSHFEFIPPRDDVFYYNDNVWKWKLGGDKLVRHDRMMLLSCLSVNREFALDHFIKRQNEIIKNGWDLDFKGEPSWARKMGYEPGTKKRKRGGITDDDFETYSSRIPNIDIRHNKTYTSPKMKLSDFKHKPKWFEEIKINEVTWWDLKMLFKL